MKRSDAGIIDNVETRNVESLPTLRDQFAMSALQGMLTTAGGPCLHGLDGIELQTATAAYSLADAMLEARK